MATEKVEWSAGLVPRSARFGDTYYSKDGGLAESREVFLCGNRLDGRLQDGFHIGELGFGTGLNLLACLDLWNTTGRTGQFRFTSFEAYPLSWQDMQRAHSGFPELSALSRQLIVCIRRGESCFRLGDASVEIVSGDAREVLPECELDIDAWFLDGFSPRCNPQMWGLALLREVARNTRSGGTFATFTAAGWVRRNLALAGFEVVRQTGFGGKRHMLVGSLTGICSSGSSRTEPQDCQ